jgi:hypothetical protein
VRVPYAPPGERLLKRSSAAHVLGISVVSLDAIRKRGEIEGVPAAGGYQRYREADVLDLRNRLDALEGPAGQESSDATT